ncbi:hypothetical protein MPH_09850 [Macrophomina phaseolina MS6]|uniref:Uncharacterized protein n=1 Tax=Macrophomina phaseolina (strain MS6) TaxID=1126212 RepID=K2S836_MACPH|nr:hypothetical protein MPH_09850 [Macrophomina phaseolina MS6]
MLSMSLSMDIPSPGKTEERHSPKGMSPSLILVLHTRMSALQAREKEKKPNAYAMQCNSFLSSPWLISREPPMHLQIRRERRLVKLAEQKRTRRRFSRTGKPSP